MYDPVVEECRHNSDIDLQCDIDVTGIGRNVNLQTDIQTTCDGEEGEFFYYYYYLRMINGNSKNFIHHTLDVRVIN
jgi:hypothetical protein